MVNKNDLLPVMKHVASISIKKNEKKNTKKGENKHKEKMHNSKITPLFCIWFLFFFDCFCIVLFWFFWIRLNMVTRIS